ncbi:unnamed protein product [Spirodela intermedia]|uniref:Uncharacterized protein n=1 Tax=Spirodela intermedia TaxID=51605 RepID=A0A7I8IAQ5_SPIIN|nr:unnamed protein product [Spirodela intermedia]CAA6654806.1 unnamed protein product [Spirodela intermedia]
MPPPPRRGLPSTSSLVSASDPRSTPKPRFSWPSGPPSSPTITGGYPSSSLPAAAAAAATRRRRTPFPSSPTFRLLSLPASSTTSSNPSCPSAALAPSPTRRSPPSSPSSFLNLTHTSRGELPPRPRRPPNGHPLWVLPAALHPPFSLLFWVHLRYPHHGRKPPAVRLLLSMRGVGYRPDLLTLNFLVSSLCSSSEVEEAVGILRGMAGAGCGPDCDSYCAVIDACCGSAVGDVPRAVALLREMVAGEGMVPRKGTVGKVVGALRREGQGRKAAKVVAFLDNEGVSVGFEEYEAVVEGCLECKEFVMAGKMVVKMSEVGFIPYIRVRHRVVEGLAGIGQQELAGGEASLAKIRS